MLRVTPIRHAIVRSLSQAPQGSQLSHRQPLLRWHRPPLGFITDGSRHRLSTDLSAILPGLLRKLDCHHRSSRHHLGMMAGVILEQSGRLHVRTHGRLQSQSSHRARSSRSPSRSSRSCSCTRSGRAFPQCRRSHLLPVGMFRSINFLSATLQRFQRTDKTKQAKATFATRGLLKKFKDGQYIGLWPFILYRFYHQSVKTGFDDPKKLYSIFC